MINTSNRLSKLDGLRGLLSLIVCLNHSFLVVAIPSFANVWQQNPFIFHDIQSKIQQLFMLLGNGGAAVTLFFLLSGLVLGQSMTKIKMNIKNIALFLIKRIIRLYPVYLLIVIATSLYMKYGFTYSTFLNSSAWFNWWMNFNLTQKEFIQNILFIHTYFGGVTWTLRVIFIVSFIFPAFVYISNKTTWWKDLIISFLLIYISFTLFNIEGFRDLRYLYMFYLGLIIPKFKNLFYSMSNRFAVFVLPFAILILLGFRYLTDEYIGGVVESIISFFVIGIAAYGEKISALNILDGKFFKFFGKISYSLYLIHFSILYIMAKTMFQYFPNLPYKNEYMLIHLVLFIISTVIATGVSLLVYRFIEQPSHSLSRKFGEKISK